MLANLSKSKGNQTIKFNLAWSKSLGRFQNSELVKSVGGMNLVKHHLIQN